MSLNQARPAALIAVGLGIALGYAAGCGDLGTRPDAPRHNSAQAATTAAADSLDRTVLPVPEPVYEPITEIDARKAKDRRTTQYFEMFGNRAIYHDGWIAATRHSIPWITTAQLPSFDKDRWELYHVVEDFSQADDLAAQHPQKLKELQDVFTKEAIRNNVFPLDDRRSERFNTAIAGRPDLIGDRKSLTLYSGMTGIAENAFINVKGRSHTITADVDVPREDARGVIIAQAGRFGGWSLYFKEGRVHSVYNFGGLDRTTVSSPEPLTPGRHTIQYEFIYDGGPPGSGGVSRISVDGKPLGEARVKRTMPFAYSGDEGVDVGTDLETPVTEEYKEGDNKFTGTIHKVTVELK